MRILVAGAGGFIGGHLVAALLAEGHQVKGVDIKPRDQWWQLHDDAYNVRGDLRREEACVDAVAGVDRVFNLACDMGGMGFIESHKADCMVSVLINTQLLYYGHKADVKRHLFASSACVYNASKQSTPGIAGLREEDAYPADPEDGYGWEKLFSERMCHHFLEDHGYQTRVARIHNCYGPLGTWRGGREKAPAALCRKVLEAKRAGAPSIELWGDGEQTRSFLYVDDCVRGLMMLIDSDVLVPINIGTDEQVSINYLAALAMFCGHVRLGTTNNLDAPQGVRGRSADLTLARRVLNWQPQVSLDVGLMRTYQWIESQFAIT